MPGIVTYGAYIPRYRVTVEEIAKVWGKDPQDISHGLFVTEKSVPGVDEDTITIACEASRQALARIDIDLQKIDALYIGSESHPYAVKPSSVTVATALGIDNHYFTADLEFACKAGTAAMQIVSSLLACRKARYGLAIGADTAQGKPGDALEYTAAAGGAAFVMGSKREEVIAEVEDYASFASDTPDFWRGKYNKYPSHSERFTGMPAYFKHVVGATEHYFKKAKCLAKDFDKAVFHMPNGKFPRVAAKVLGFKESQIKDSLVVDLIGNTYSASSLLGLVRVLDKAKPGERILVTSYGSGSGSDVFVFKVTDNIKNLRKGQKLNSMIKDKKYLSYGEYCKHTGKIVQN